MQFVKQLGTLPPNYTHCPDCCFDLANEGCVVGCYGAEGYYKEDRTQPANNPLDKQIAGDHYKNFKVQPVEFCHKNQLGICESNIVKYACRHKDKGKAEDIRKIIHYAQLLLQLEYGETE